ncbi:MAG: acetoin utilization protein AcuC [Frankiaceae bacterium]|nr:acetoin utilization protein AcuC [Frankiaceae bacterium]
MTAAVAWDPALLGYGFGPGHPFDPLRLELTMELARSLGVAGAMLAFEPASDELLTTVHEPAYVEAVQRGETNFEHGLGTADNPVFPSMHEATALVVGATVAAARAVHSGAVTHGVSIAGGLHHAMPATASGFCLYNDVAVAITDLLARGAERVAYVDIDVHHGDGVQAVFYDDPRVLTISLHETGRTLFPGTGFPSETGGPDAVGTSVNVALPAGTGDPGWLRAFDAVVPPLVRAFAPTVLVSQHGCDTHALDPLANLLVSVDGQRVAHAALHDLAHDVCGGRWLATGGGGYEIVRVVPRTWTHLLAIATGSPVDPETETPDEWRSFVHGRTGWTAPLRMTDGRAAAFSPYGSGDADPVDTAIRATREAVFPTHGLEP